MKKMKNFRIFIVLLTIGILNLIFNSCNPDHPCSEKPCTSSSSDITKSINGFDFNSNSAFFNQVVANFKFTQTTSVFSPPNECSNCPLTSYSVALQITNETNKIINFDYSISFHLNLDSWNYQNVAVINPNATINVGEISNHGASISLGQIVIQSNNIAYH